MILTFCCQQCNVAASTIAAAAHTQLQVFTRTLKSCLISKTRTRRSSLIWRKKKKNISRRKAMWRQLYWWPAERREPIIIRNNCNHTYSLQLSCHWTMRETTIKSTYHARESRVSWQTHNESMDIRHTVPHTASLRSCARGAWSYPNVVVRLLYLDLYYLCICLFACLFVCLYLYLSIYDLYVYLYW